MTVFISIFKMLRIGTRSFSAKYGKTSSSSNILIKKQRDVLAFSGSKDRLADGNIAKPDQTQKPKNFKNPPKMASTNFVKKISVDEKNSTPKDEKSMENLPNKTPSTEAKNLANPRRKKSSAQLINKILWNMQKPKNDILHPKIPTESIFDPENDNLEEFTEISEVLEELKPSGNLITLYGSVDPESIDYEEKTFYFNFIDHYVIDVNGQRGVKQGLELRSTIKCQFLRENYRLDSFFVSFFFGLFWPIFARVDWLVLAYF